MSRLNVFKIIEEHNNFDTALLYRGKKTTYKELLEKSKKLSDVINKHTENIPEPVGVFISGSLDFSVSFFSIAHADKVIMPLNVNLKKAEFVRIIKYLDIRIIITNDLFYDRLIKLIDNDITVICLNADGDVKFVNDVTDMRHIEYNNELKDVALILHTSGSLDSPKSVMLTHENLLSCIHSISEDLNITQKNNTLIILPMYYASATISQFLTHLYAGGTVTFMDTIFTSENLFYNIANYKITNFSCIPSMLSEVLNNLSKIEKYDLSSLKYVCFGGAFAAGNKVNELVKYFSNVRFIRTYGLTEASTRISHYVEQPDVINDTCVGKCIPNVKVRIVDKNENDCRIGEIGEITVKGPNVMKGYYMRTDETEKVMINGWLHTGDLGRIDEENNLNIVGRRKNIIIRNAENIYSEEIEGVLNSCPQIKESFVYGEPHELLGEVPAAIIVINDGFEFKKQELINYCYNKLSSSKIPVKFIVADKIEKTSNGKIDRGFRKEEFV